MGQNLSRKPNLLFYTLWADNISDAVYCVGWNVKAQGHIWNYISWRYWAWKIQRGWYCPGQAQVDGISFFKFSFRMTRLFPVCYLSCLNYCVSSKFFKKYFGSSLKDNFLSAQNILLLNIISRYNNVSKRAEQEKLLCNVCVCIEVKNSQHTQTRTSILSWIIFL